MGWTNEFRFRDCAWCGLRHAELRLIAGPNLETVGTELIGPEPGDHGKVGKSLPRWWAVIACPSCGGVMLIEHNHPEHATPEQLKFVPAYDRAADVEALPERVEYYYSRSNRALDAGIPDYAMLDLRKALEAACANLLPEKDRIIPGKGREQPLSKQVQSLVDQGHVTPEVGKALHRIREVGNVSGHIVETRGVQTNVSREEAVQAIAIARQAFRVLYEIPKVISEL